MDTTEFERLVRIANRHRACGQDYKSRNLPFHVNETLLELQSLWAAVDEAAALLGVAL